MDPLDHKHLDRDVPYFQHTTRCSTFHPLFSLPLLNPLLYLFALTALTACSTTENLAVFIWDSLVASLQDTTCRLHQARCMQHPLTLHSLGQITIEETPNNIVVYRGQ